MQTQVFKALSDPTRLRCIMLLAEYQELCVCDLTSALELSQPRVSHHLSNLRKAGLVHDRKQGLWHFYQLHPDLPAWARRVIDDTHSGLADQPPFSEDRIRLNQNENAGCCA